MAIPLMAHIFQSNMFKIRPYNEVMTPSCAAPTQGSLPYIWPACVWLRRTAGQMLHPCQPRPAALSARGWSRTHTYTLIHRHMHAHTHAHTQTHARTHAPSHTDTCTHSPPHPLHLEH